MGSGIESNALSSCDQLTGPSVTNSGSDGTDSEAGIIKDTTAPTGTLSVDTDPMYEGDLTQVVTITYDETMDNGTTPTISFTATTGTITTQGNGAWSGVDTVRLFGGIAPCFVVGLAWQYGWLSGRVRRDPGGDTGIFLASRESVLRLLFDQEPGVYCPLCGTFGLCRGWVSVGDESDGGV